MVAGLACFSNPPSYTGMQSHGRQVGGGKPDEEEALRFSRIVGDWAYLVKPKLFRITPPPKKIWVGHDPNTGRSAPRKRGGKRFFLKIICKALRGTTHAFTLPGSCQERSELCVTSVVTPLGLHKKSDFLTQETQKFIV
jgi:hypothetical protein